MQPARDQTADNTADDWGDPEQPQARQRNAALRRLGVLVAMQTFNAGADPCPLSGVKRTLLGGAPSHPCANARFCKRFSFDLDQIHGTQVLI